jgi:hypothetical protein
MSTEPITISFVGTTEIKLWLEQWAKEDERSISYILRKILQCEYLRRQAGNGTGRVESEKPTSNSTGR